MKVVLVIAIVLGFGATLAGAHLVPGLGHARLPSQTAVVANGGRSELFVVRLPADRLAATDGEVGGLRAAAGAMRLPAQLVGEPVLVEHFKVRDRGGNVIGVAARHWSATAGGAATTWSLLVPSRGTLVLSAPGERSGAVETALRARGYTAGSAWDGEVSVTMTPADGGGVVAGTGEFAHLAGSYTEAWTVAGVDAAGALHGTITLDTVTSRPE